MTDQPESPAPPKQEGDEAGETPGRFAELDELQREVARRIRDNRRFLEHFLDDDFEDGEETEETEGEDEEFEEL